MNILDIKKMNICFEWLVGPISFQGFYYLYRGLRRAPKPYFGLILEFWIIFHIFFEWIILLNILDSIEWFFLNEYSGFRFELNF